MRTLRKMPLLRVALSFIAGILLQHFFRLSPDWDLIILTCGIALLVAGKRKRWTIKHKTRFVSGLGLTLILIACAALYYEISSSPDLPLISGKQELAVSVESPIVVKHGRIQFEASCSFLPGKILVNSEAALQKRLSVLKVGDSLVIFGEVKEPPEPLNPLQFDYKEYLRIQGINYQLYLKHGNLRKVVPQLRFSLTQLSADIRKVISRKMGEAGLDGNELAIAAALVIGEESFLNPEIRSAYAASGAMHVLSVSGLHIGVVFILLRFLFSPLLKRKANKGWITIFIILLLWVYCFITGMSPCVQRAGWMFSLVAFGSVQKRISNIFNTLSASALVLLLIDPKLLFDVGFELSYIALLGILILQKPILRLLYFRNKLLYSTWEITAVAIAAQIATFPLSLYYFHQFPNYFLIANLLVIPLSFVILMIGVAFIVLCWFSWGAAVLGFLLNWSVRILNEFLIWLESWPGAVCELLYLDALSSWLLYLTLGFLCGLILLRSKLAVIPLLFSLLLFCTRQLILVIEENSELVIYNVPHRTVIGSYCGNSREVISDSLGLKELSFFVGTHVAKEGAERSGHFNSSSKNFMQLPDSNLVFFYPTGKLLILHHPPDTKRLQGVHFDVVLIETSVFDWKQIKNLSFKMCLVGNRLNFRESNKISRFLKRRGIPFTVLKTSCALILH